jgi:Flp pilus assembly protein TadG
MNKAHPSNRGQVLIIFVLVIVALIGFTGLAVDGGNIYSDRRQAQNAADTAALAASLQRISWSKANSGAVCSSFDTENHVLPSCSSSTINTALDMAAKNGYQNNGGNTKVYVYSPPKDGPYASCSSPCVPADYIEVVIQHDNPTYFAKVLGIQTLSNTVQATALSKYKPSSAYYGGMTLVELATGNGNCPSDFDVAGGGTITLNGGGIWVNSSNPACAYKQTSCNTSVLGTGTIQVVGGADTNGCTSNQIQPTTGVSPQYPYTPAHIFDPPPWKPPYCTSHPRTSASASISGGVATYPPGDYENQGAFPMYNGPAVMQPGVYCIDRLQSNKDITGNGVFIYIYPTGINQSQVDLSGSGANHVGGVINLTAITDANNPFAGYLIYGDYDNNSTPSNPPTCTIAGGTNSIYTGMIWVPLCSLTIAGNTASNGESAQIIAADIKLTGTMNLSFTYDSSKFPQIPEENKTGLYR